MNFQIYFLELKIAIRYLFNRTEEGFISLISIFSFFGIFLGISTLIIVISVMNGFREKLIDGMLGFSGHIKISSFNKSDNFIENFDEIIKKIDEFKNSSIYDEILKKHKISIIKTIPIIKSHALITSFNDKNHIRPIMVFSEKNNDKKLSDILIINKDFKFNTTKSKDQILIGSRMAEENILKIGDKINIMSPSSDSMMTGDINLSKEFEIAGIFETEIFDIDNNVIFMDFDIASSLFDYPDSSASEIEINTSNPSLSIILKKSLLDFFKYYEEFDYLNFSDWSEINVQYLNALKMEKKVMFLILSFIILIAVFNVMSSLTMLVNEKTKSIAILRTMGMTSFSIMRIFFYSGMIISVSAILLGSIFGIIFVKNLHNIKNFLEYSLDIEFFNPIVYLLKDIPAIIDFYDIFWIIFFTMNISILASLPPSIKASKKDPAKILKYL